MDNANEKSLKKTTTKMKNRATTPKLLKRVLYLDSRSDALNLSIKKCSGSLILLNPL